MTNHMLIDSCFFQRTGEGYAKYLKPPFCIIVTQWLKNNLASSKGYWTKMIPSG